MLMLYPKIFSIFINLSKILFVFEFHFDHCLIKHKKIKDIILQEKVKNGLYVFQNFVYIFSINIHFIIS